LFFSLRVKLASHWPSMSLSLVMIDKESLRFWCARVVVTEI